jgi:hypothetical protein
MDSQTEPDRRQFLRSSVGGMLAAALARDSACLAGTAPTRSAKEKRMLRVTTNYYQQFDADFRLDVPGEGYGGWKRTDLDFDLARTAVVVMHAWDSGTREEFPGWYRCVEYIPREQEICRTVFPRLLGAVRAAKVNLFHVVGGGKYYQDLPGYRRAVQLAGPAPAAPETIATDPTLDALRRFRSERVFVGKHNQADVSRGFARLDFDPHARPVGDEGVAENGHQLFALCKATGVNHLIYAGFAINWCLLLSPGGMHDMSARGVMCSAFRQATTAVENKESARKQLCKELALWRVALAFGFVFDVDDFLAALQRSGSGT